MYFLGIKTVVAHKEGPTGSGFYEIALMYYPVTESVDKMFLSKETIYAICKKFGLKVCWNPKPPKVGMLGLHVHLSLTDIKTGKFK